MSIRITGGVFCGRTIPAPVGRTRPTAAVVRQALFNILGDISGMSFCDLYAGSAAVGIEALSRGAGFVEFVERDPLIARSIENTIVRFDLPRDSVARVRPMDVKRWVDISRDLFDIIFADPPYIEKEIEGLFGLIPGVIERLKPVGIFILQIGKKYSPPEGHSDLRRFGDDVLYFWRKR